MAQSEKFLFETSFDPGSPDAPGGAKKAPPPSFTEIDLVEAEDRARAEGRQSGLEEAKQGAEHLAAQALGVLGHEFGELRRQFDEAMARHERQTLEIAALALRKLFPELTRRHGLEEAEALVAQCLESLRTEPRVVIRTADSLHDALRGRLETLAQASGFEGQLMLLAEEGLGPSDLRVEWADGGAERDTGRLWSEIEVALGRALGHAPGHTLDTAAQASNEQLAGMAPAGDPPGDPPGDPLTGPGCVPPHPDTETTENPKTEATAAPEA